jgi:hypothetical protein
LDEKTWKKGDEAEELPVDPPEVGFLELEKEVDAACFCLAEVRAFPIQHIPPLRLPIPRD